MNQVMVMMHTLAVAMRRMLVLVLAVVQDGMAQAMVQDLQLAW